MRLLLLTWTLACAVLFGARSPCVSRSTFNLGNSVSNVAGESAIAALARGTARFDACIRALAPQDALPADLFADTASRVEGVEETESESESEDGDDTCSEDLGLFPDLAVSCPQAAAELWLLPPRSAVRGRLIAAPETPPPRA